jgi:hypothetical protein
MIKSFWFQVISHHVPGSNTFCNRPEGHIHLLTAKSSDDPKHHYDEAEKKFIEAAATAADLGTPRSHAFRRAAIAAKLKGDKGAAKSHFAEAKKARLQADTKKNEVYLDQPQGDIEKLYDECRDAKTLTISGLKMFAMSPFILAEGLCKEKGAELKTLKAYEKMSPYMTAVSKAEDTLKAKYKELDGEASDEEWIESEADPKGKQKSTSTGKGLRHPYI